MRFSPLHEGDASVANYGCGVSPFHWSFQSPSRGGRLCGPGFRRRGLCRVRVSVPFTRGTPLWRGSRAFGLRSGRVSVPFTRGTPLWRRKRRPKLGPWPGFSPLHEGDASVAGTGRRRARDRHRFSPLHEGDASVAMARVRLCGRPILVSVPFTRGTPLWHPSGGVDALGNEQFQSPSRGGRLCGILSDFGYPYPCPGFSPLHEGDASVALSCAEAGDGVGQVSVPFTRGTPLWRRFRWLTNSPGTRFQSPSRGGRLCGWSNPG